MLSVTIFCCILYNMLIKTYDTDTVGHSAVHLWLKIGMLRIL